MLSLCLSRACLGQMMHFIHKWRNEWRFPHLVTALPERLCGVVCEASHLRKTHLFSQLFLCLSRACLGKRSFLNINGISKSGVFSPHHARVGADGELQRGQRHRLAQRHERLIAITTTSGGPRRRRFVAASLQPPEDGEERDLLQPAAENVVALLL